MDRFLVFLVVDVLKYILYLGYCGLLLGLVVGFVLFLEGLINDLVG